MKNKKIMDLFCGCGGLSLGFEAAGFDIELAIDMWEDAIKTYNRNHDSVAKCIDIQDLSDDYLKSFVGNVIGVIGGPPCQGFSSVGNREIDDPRNHLYLEYCRVVELVKPEFFLIENVKGLTTLGGGIFKQDIIDRFTKMGYNVSEKILNAANYGVPQNRERVFFVGISGKKFVFPEPDNIVITTKDALSDLPFEEGEKNYLFDPQNEYQRLMRKVDIIYNHEFTRHTKQTVEIISMVPDGGNIKNLPEEYWSIRKYNKAFERMNSDKPSNTIDTGHRNYFHYKYNRIPTVRECARIQSFPDSFEFVGSKTSQYKQVGNAVPPLLAKKVAKSILNILEHDIDG